MSLMDAIGQLWSPIDGIGGKYQDFPQQELAQKSAQFHAAYANCKPDSAYYQLLMQYKDMIWVPPGWQYWFEIGDELL